MHEPHARISAPPATAASLPDDVTPSGACASGALIARNPATGDEIRRVPRPSACDVHAAIARARLASVCLAQAPLSVRARLLRRIADALESNAEPLARRVVAESGKTLAHALEADLAGAIAVLRHTARIGPHALSERQEWSPAGALLGRLHRSESRPLGVVALITPWNYPMGIVVSGLAPALMAGNAVVFKPSELAIDCAYALAEIVADSLRACSLPQDALTLLPGDGAVGEILTDGAIDHCLFTGSAAVGRRVRDKLTARGISTSLELGGSCPLILLENRGGDRQAALQTALSYALFGRLANNGQACGAVKRLYVPRADVPAVLAALETAMRAVRLGPPLDSATHVGPLISDRQRATLHAQIEDARARGARILCGGVIPEGPGWYYPPTLLSDVPPGARVLTEETFGPALPVIAYDDASHAVALANDSPYALTASVFGDPQEAAALARQLTAPLVAINDLALLNYSLPQIPWRGRQDSGWGAGVHGAPILDALSERRYYSRNVTIRWPFLRKPPWHLHRGDCAQDAAFSARVLAFTGGSPFWRWLRPSLARGFFQRRASRQW